MIALIERQTSGKGQWVQSSLLQAGISLLDFQAARYLMEGDVPPQVGNDHPTSMPTSAYKTKDGHINGSFGRGHVDEPARPWGAKTCCRRRSSRAARSAENRKQLNAAIEEALKKKTSAEWIEILNREGIPCGPIYKVDEVFADPQVKHLGIATPVDHPKLGRKDILANAAVLSRTPAKVVAPTPEIGEHTDEILRELEYSAQQIEQLRQGGVV